MLNTIEMKRVMDPVASNPPMPRLRVEPRRSPADVLTLVVAAWIGKKNYCEARIVERKGDSITVLSAAPLEPGEQVWFAESDSAGGMFVRNAAQEGSGYRLELEREKRRSPRWRIDEQGEVEWRGGGKTGRANVVVVDVSAGGLRIRTNESVPETGEVRVKFAGMVRNGEIRYALPLGGATVVGVEFA
jgi:hypothetical protein